MEGRRQRAKCVHDLFFHLLHLCHDWLIEVETKLVNIPVSIASLAFKPDLSPAVSLRANTASSIYLSCHHAIRAKIGIIL